jgi:radical SAM protein with 4Fe4S-binding SPASM domain
MKIQAKDLRSKRTNLWEVVPIRSPWAMFIDVTNVCNFKCVFCPTGNPEMITERKVMHMRVDTFAKIISDLLDVPKLKILNLYKDGEPLANPLFTDFVSLAKENNVADRIWTKTNGTLINRHKDLTTCGLDMLGISVPHVTDEGIQKTIGRKLDYELYVHNIKKLFESKRTFEMSIKIADNGLTDSEKDKFYNDFEHICEYVTIEGLHGWSASDVKNMQTYDSGTFDGNPFVQKVCCPLVFYMMTINADGTVSVCNDDWQYNHKLGNVNKDSIVDIWNGNKFKDFRIMHLTGNRSHNKSCATCQYISALPDNVDKHLDEMIKRMI